MVMVSYLRGLWAWRMLGVPSWEAMSLFLRAVQLNCRTATRVCAPSAATQAPLAIRAHDRIAITVMDAELNSVISSRSPCIVDEVSMEFRGTEPTL